jgi:hypothetical protein|tara:strand:+ start:1664 stop:1822 length:159 start_codon:yes stop_codon:yes gene_type:complete
MAKLKGKQRKLDKNKNGRIDAQDFKMLRGSKMYGGGKLKTKMKSGGRLNQHR